MEDLLSVFMDYIEQITPKQFLRWVNSHKVTRLLYKGVVFVLAFLLTGLAGAFAGALLVLFFGESGI